jgi:hypothetical protein
MNCNSSNSWKLLHVAVILFCSVYWGGRAQWNYIKYLKHIHGFHVFDSIPFALFQPLLWAVLPSAASCDMDPIWQRSINYNMFTVGSKNAVGQTYFQLIDVIYWCFSSTLFFPKHENMTINRNYACAILGALNKYARVEHEHTRWVWEILRKWGITQNTMLGETIC